MPNQRIATLLVFGCSWLLAVSPTLSQNSSGLRPPISGNPKPNPNAIAQASPLRFLIREGNRLGYIDQTGKIVIAPQFAGHESGAVSLSVDRKLFPETAITQILYSVILWPEFHRLDKQAPID